LIPGSLNGVELPLLRFANGTRARAVHSYLDMPAATRRQGAERWKSNWGDVRGQTGARQSARADVDDRSDDFRRWC
jgi:hypothetical protein